MVRVYAYGCGQPISGWPQALAESELCNDMWDELVALERRMADTELNIARSDDGALDSLCVRIAEWSDALRANPDDKEARGLRRGGFREQRKLLYAWRKGHKDVGKALNDERNQAVVAIRQKYTNESDGERLYWGNSNRVLQSYETGRKVAARKGRLIRPRDLERDDGVLMVQMQRTRTGLGAAPQELTDGTFKHLQISMPNDRGQARISMRVDMAEHHLVLPVWIHRPLPPKGRVKAAQITWRRRGNDLKFQLCMTVDKATQTPMRTAGDALTVEFDWKDQGAIEVMRIGGKVWRLPLSWVARMDGIEAHQSLLDEAWKVVLALPHPAIISASALPTQRERLAELIARRDMLPEEVRNRMLPELRRLWIGLPGRRAHALGARRELYRQWAREVACSYATLSLPELDIAQIATAERGEDRNSVRHRAAVHTLRQEIIWQCTKAGTPVMDASGKVLNAPKDGKSSAWARRKGAKAERSQTDGQPHDGP